MIKVTRRQAVGGALALPALLAGCAKTPNPYDVPPADVLQVGKSGRIRGVCIGPGTADSREDSAWTGLWQRWDWPNRIQRELDDATAVGANCVRLIGNTHVVTSGLISLVEYLEHWSQFLDYAKMAGLWVYPCGGDLSHWGGNTSLAAAESIYHQWAELLASHDHIVGVDITNEASAQSRVVGGIAYQAPESWFYTIRRLGELVRSVSSKPITHSRGLVAYDAASWQFGSPRNRPIVGLLGRALLPRNIAERRRRSLCRRVGSRKATYYRRIRRQHDRRFGFANGNL